MAKTDNKRFDDTLAYIHRNISSDLAVSIVSALKERNADDLARDLALDDEDDVPVGGKQQVGKGLSLKGGSYGVFSSQGQRDAIRALLLCQNAFLRAPWARGSDGAPFNYNGSPDLPKSHYRFSTESTVKRALRAYITEPASLIGLAAAAETMDSPRGPTQWETIHRATSPFPQMPVCFDALKMLLFKAGYISIRYLSKTGPSMTAQTVNSILGWGQKITEQDLNQIPRGFLFNFHRKGDPAVCHWGVSLGQGKAAGANTSSDWPGAARPVHFFSGGSAYGVFTLASALEVCKHKYKRQGEPVAAVTIRQIDPRAVDSYF